MNRLREALQTSRRAGDRGVTLIELLVTMILMGVVSSLVLGAVIQSTRVLTHVDDEESGLSDAKIVFDRIARDVRESRGVVCDGGLADPADASSADPYCAAHLQVWVDSNSDYVEQPGEWITWRLEQNVDGVHHDVWRVTGKDGTPQTRHQQASSLIVDAVFGYRDGSGLIAANVLPTAAQQVDITLTYDTIVGRGANPRSVEFSARLRNKG